MKAALLMVVLWAGCGEPGGRVIRYPKHRESEELRIKTLEDQVAKLQQQVAALGARVAPAAP